MHRLAHQLLGVSAIAVAGGLAATGCADNDRSLFISAVIKPEPPECTVTPDANVTVLGRGFLDVHFSFEYLAWLLVGNQLTPRGDKKNLRVETSRVTLRGAEVVVENALGGELAAFTVPGTGFTHPETSEDPGFGAFLATLIPAQVGADFASLAPFNDRVTLVANVRVFGDTLGGDELESSELGFPIVVCNGCTIEYPLEAIDPATGTCILNADGAEDRPCFAGQDSMDCRLCARDRDRPLCLAPP